LSYKDDEVEGVVTAVVCCQKSNIGPMCCSTALHTFFNGETKEETFHLSKIKEVNPPTPTVEAVVATDVIEAIIGSIDPKNNEIASEALAVVDAVEEGVIDNNDNENNKAFNNNNHITIVDAEKVVEQSNNNFNQKPPAKQKQLVLGLLTATEVHIQIRNS
jgi:hypothetical protein